MTLFYERRTLQLAVMLACIVPILTGTLGIIVGYQPSDDFQSNPSFDSHFRYLSGLLFGIGLSFLWMVPRIEQHGKLFRALAIIIFIGGLARVLSLWASGIPNLINQAALVMELGIVPLLALWQGRVAKRIEYCHSREGGNSDHIKIM